MKTVYDVLRGWMPKFDPQGPTAFVSTDTMDFSGTCGYLTNHVWADNMKALKPIEVDEDRHVIYAEKI